MKEEAIDIRDELLKTAGYAFTNKFIPFGNDPITGDEAIKIGLDIVDLVEHFDREFCYKKKK